MLGSKEVPLRESDIVAPAEMIAFGDTASTGPDKSVWAGVGLTRIPTISIGPSSDLKPAIRYAQQRHRGRMNIDFCDGHVENFKAQKFMTDDSDEARRRWNRDNQSHR